MKKLTERYMKLYRIKKIILENVIELELSELIEIYLVMNISGIMIYKEQAKRQKKIPSYSIEIKRVKEYEVEKIEKILERSSSTWYNGKNIWQNKIIGNNQRVWKIQ